MTLHSEKSPSTGHANTIWVFSELYYPEGSATGYYLTKIAEGLAVQRPVRVLCAQPTYSARGTKAPWSEVHNGVHIRRCWGTKLDKDTLVFRVLNLLSITISVLWRALRSVKAREPILAVTNPPTLPFVAVVVSLIKGSPCVVLIHDVYPDVLVAAGLGRRNSLGIRLVGSVHRWLYKRASALVVLGRDMKALVQARLDDPRKEISIVTNWADIDTIVPAPRGENALLKELGILDKFVVQYSGNMGRTHDLESLVECARLCEGELGVHLLFLGSGAKEVWLRRTVADLGLSNVTVLSPRPRSEIPVSLSACDLAVIAFVSKMAGVSVPSRMYNVMAAGRPILVIAEPTSELGLLVQEEGIGWVVEPGRPDLVKAAVVEALRNPDLLLEMGERASCVARTKYSSQAVLAQYNSLFDRISSSRGGDGRARGH